MQLTTQEFEERAIKLYGTDRTKWKFRCCGYKNKGEGPKCDNVQSAESIIEQQKNGVVSLRYGKLEGGTALFPDCECYAPDCNWAAYGLFNSHIRLVDPANPGCYSFIFPLADDEEMLAAAGIKKGEDNVKKTKK